MYPTTNIALLTSWPMDVRIGSGVVRMLQGFRSGFEKNGVRCQIIHPDFLPKNDTDLYTLRMQFNQYLSQLDYSAFDYIIGSDFDGFLLPPGWLDRYYAMNGGLLADLVQFEKGKNADILRAMAGQEKKNMLQAKRIFVPSEYSAQKLQELYEIPLQRVRVIPLGIDYEQWRGLLRAAPLNKETGTKQVLCVARQYVRKGIDDLIKAMHLLHDQLPSVQLILVGDGQEQERLKTLTRTLKAESYIYFEGSVKDRKRLAAYYRNADVFCLPSYHETFGLVFLEAMAAGLPVVSYASTSITEVVTPETGLLCPPGDLSCLVNSLYELLTKSEKRAELGHKGMKRVRAMSWQRAAKQVLNALNEGM